MLTQKIVKSQLFSFVHREYCFFACYNLQLVANEQRMEISVTTDVSQRGSCGSIFYIFLTRLSLFFHLAGLHSALLRFGTHNTLLCVGL